VKALASGLLTTMATLFAQDKPPVPYPDGFRSWSHVKSLIVGRSTARSGLRQLLPQLEPSTVNTKAGPWLGLVSIPNFQLPTSNPKLAVPKIARS